MTEYNIGFSAAGSIFGLALFCTFYMLGGRKNKWLRRFVGSFIQAVNSNICSFIMGIWSWWLLLIFPLVSIGTSFGYGADTFGTKVLRRSIFCLANLTVGLLFVIKYGGPMWWIFIPNVGVAAWSIYLGVKNPLYAAAEEVFVCALLYLMTCAYPFTIGMVK